MIKHLLVFLGAFALAATVTLTLRARMHQPASAEAAVAVTPAADPLAGHAHSTAARAPSPAPVQESAPAAALTSDAPVAAGTVNTICPICGMDVDPSIPAATYQGKLVGFGCGACPPRFAKDPDRYGPSALENKVAGR